MQLTVWRHRLRLAHPWVIARTWRKTSLEENHSSTTVLLELRDADGLTGLGEAAPSRRYHETPQSVIEFLARVDPHRLSFGAVDDSMAYLESIAPGHAAAKGALNLALLDGASRRAGQPLCDFLGLGFREQAHVTSYSIGLDHPDVIRRKVVLAQSYPILKLKVGSPHDADNLAALRAEAPTKPVRVDANEAWTTPAEALSHLERLACDGHIELVEQPMPATASPQDWAWLKARSPLPIMADESCLTAADIPRCAESFHAVNVKLVKTAGITGALATLRAARAAGLKTMIGCMIETSILATAAAHLAELADYLDLDGNLLITNDPFRGTTAVHGLLSFATAPDPVGLRVCRRESASSRAEHPAAQPSG